MNLIIQKELADLVGVSSAAITKARKNNRVEHYKGTKEYDTDSPLNRAFINMIPDERLNKIIKVPSQTISPSKNQDLEQAVTNVQEAQAQKTIEEGLLTEQKRIEKEMKNASRRGELVELEKINQFIMTFFDRFINTNKRYFSAIYDEVVRETLVLNEKVPGLKQKFLNEMEAATDEAKVTTCKLLREIQMEQGKS